LKQASQNYHNPKIVLIDGNSLAYRAFYALPESMRTAGGLSTNAIYGFTTMLLKILEDQPDLVAISFDLPEPTFRHKEYKEYKATREKAPPPLYQQLPYVKEVALAFDIPIYEASGYEADDVIGTLARAAERQGYEVTILSGDLDPLQLVDDKIKVLTTRQGISDTVLYGEKEVEQRFRLKPEQLIDFKALKGDASDNIPGVPKIGDKTAEALLKEFGSLENIFKNIDKVEKTSLRENLKRNQHLADLSKRLATIVTDVPLEIDFEKAKRGKINWQKVLPLFEKFEFESLIKKYGRGVEAFQAEKVIKKKREEISKFDFKCLVSEKEVEVLLAQLWQSPAFAFDLETTSLDTFTAEIVGISFSTKSESAYYLPLPSKDKLKILSPLLLSDKLKIGHNLKYDIKVLNNNGVEVLGPFFDTMVAAYLLDPVSGKYSLKHLAKQFLTRKMIEFQELVGKDAQYQNFSQVPLELAADYACSDAEATFSLYEIYHLAIKAQKQEKLFYQVEMPLLDSLIKMEEGGVSIDPALLKKFSAEIEKELKELERHIFAIAGEIFNINSPKQLAVILFNKLMLPVIKRGPTGPSTDVEVLEELASRKFEIAEKLIDYRQLTKLKNTYVDVLPALINPKTGRLHSSFNQTITATGRLSSSGPNLQNIPARGEWGKKIRCAFVPEKEGWAIMAADYSQIELRILAHLSDDPELIRAFREEQDIHQVTADELGISRAAAKTVNFGIIYGISDFGLAKSLNLKKTEAAAYIQKYFQKYQGVKDFIEKTIREARENLYVTTLLGRRRPMPDINSPHTGLRAAAERMAINAPVQGTAADMIKVAMVNISAKFKAENIKSRLILQVHDELVFECPSPELETIKKIVREEMERALPLKVLVKVDIGVGKNWAQTKEKT
jgi:DNA polymerase-1